jgi:hypothetical protein
MTECNSSLRALTLMFFLTSLTLQLFAEESFSKRITLSELNEFGALNLVVPDGKLRIRVLNPEGNSGFDINCGGGVTTCQLFPKRFFPETCERLINVTPAVPTDNLAWFQFKRTERVWSAYINDHEIVRMPELWKGTLEIQHPEQLTPSDDDIDDFTQKIGDFTFEDNFLVPAGSAFPPAWEIINGAWKLHSVTGSVSGTGGYTLARQPKPEKSPNFYTLEGGGTNGVVLAGEPFYSRYRISAAVQHNSGTNGLVFLAPELGGYMAFTARTDPQSGTLALDLWRQPADPKDAPEYLESVQSELPVGQWLLLEVCLLDNAVICKADHIPVIRKRLPLSPGGRFGLYANMPPGDVTRFDDVSVSTHDDILFETPGDVNFQTVPGTAGVRSLLRNDTCWLYFPPTHQTNRWLFGTANSAPLRQETTAVSVTNIFTFGLNCGAVSNNAPYYSFTCTQSDSNRVYTLKLVNTTNILALDSFTTAVTSNRVNLAIDALRKHELRCYADGHLVCFTRPTQQPGGIQGVFASNPDDLFFTAPQVTSVDPVLSERFEKNPLYVNDPFMRHWASPEGQWVIFEDGMTWFKGDITGAVKVRLPIVENSVLHLCVPENSSNGVCRVAVTNSTIHLYTGINSTQSVFSVKAEQIPEVEYDKKKIRVFTVGMEDYVIWIGTDDTLIASTHLDELPNGRRMRIEKMKLTDLKHTLVQRDNVFDTLFTESLFNWTINGGRWEVVNRFFCEPTWSHMNGESHDSLAALWSKYIFEGDFSIEFYAGMRMGWYTRPGDLNLTVMSKRNLTADGYTAIATGWDPDHSQLYSRLLRNGDVMDITTKYLVPRTREGLARKGYQPLVAKGREIHGAWYGMQLRRIGNQLKYIYDNEDVFEVTDDQPLQNGTLGIWTYCNSMMVARIKIAAEKIRPRPFDFHSIPAGAALKPMETKSLDSGLRINNRLIQPLSPECWEPFDTVSHPIINFKNITSEKPEMHVHSLLGAGTFLVKCNLPPATPDKLLGWRFEMARHPEAQVNFEFTTLTENKKKQTVPVQGWSYILSGTTERRGPRKIAGQIKELPPSDPEGKNLIWTPVEIWIPSEVIRDNMAVQIEGFGNLQPSEAQQGLHGNPPHSWYAIRAFREIHRGVPVATAPSEKRTQVTELNKLINSLPPGELQMVKVPPTLDPAEPVVEWAVPEMADFGLLAHEDKSIPGSLLITPTHPWPSPLLPPKKVLTDAQPAPFEVEGNNIRVLIPLEHLQPDHMTLTAELSDGRYFRQVVPMKLNNTTNFPPSLLSLEMPQGSIKTFEERPQDADQHKHKAYISFDYSDPSRGGTLKISNNGEALRLYGYLTKSIDLAATPVIQFRYRGDPMSLCSLSYGSTGFTFSEKYNTGIRYSGKSTAVMDKKWHTWMGLPSDALGKAQLQERSSIKPSYMLFASRSSVDQSGLHSWLQIDDIATGPAVGPNRPFAFKADYIDQDGVATVEYALLTGDQPYDTRAPESQQQIKWITTQNSKVTQPALDGIADGIHHLLVRAKDNRGLWSHPSDTPFILDSKSPAVNHEIKSVPNYNGSCLNLSITDTVAPPIINDLSFTCNGTTLDISKDNGFCNIGQGNIDMQIDWIWTLRKILMDTPHGTQLPLTISGITDAAGNQLPPYVAKIPIDKQSDKRPPTLLPQKPPSNTYSWNPTFTDVKQFFTRYPYVNLETVETEDGAVLQISYKNKSSTYLQRSFPSSYWNTEKYPFLSISFRTIAKPYKSSPYKFTLHNADKRAPGNLAKITLTLTDPQHQKFIHGKISTEPGEWNDLIINIRDFLRAQTDEKKAFTVRYLTAYICGRSKGSVAQIRSISILAPWTSKSTLDYVAYDLNGIKKREWQGGYVDKIIKPADVKPATDDPHWMRIRFEDGAGNKAPLQMVPLLPELTK